MFSSRKIQNSPEKKAEIAESMYNLSKEIIDNSKSHNWVLREEEFEQLITCIQVIAACAVLKQQQEFWWLMTKAYSDVKVKLGGNNQTYHDYCNLVNYVNELFAPKIFKNKQPIAFAQEMRKRKSPPGPQL